MQHCRCVNSVLPLITSFRKGPFLPCYHCLEPPMGCGASAQNGSGGQKPAPATQAAQPAPVAAEKTVKPAAPPTPAAAPAKPEKEELAGKVKYVGDIGAAVMGLEDKKALHTLFIAYIPPGQPKQFSFVYFQNALQKMFVLTLTDEEFEALKAKCNVTFGWNAIFKSIASELQRSKAKVNVADGAATAEIVMTTVKEKTTQLLKVVMPDVGTLTAKANHDNVIIPLTMLLQKRRQASEEREKETKASLMQVKVLVNDANMLKHKATIARILPLIVPLREESARHAKASAELTSKVASLDRKIKQLTRGKGQNYLDAMY